MDTQNTGAPDISQGAALGLRIPRMLGRAKEIENLRACLYAAHDRHFIYYKAGGGLGKTRLLEELQHLVAEAGEGYYTSGIIDLYHTDMHSTSDVERAIAEGLGWEKDEQGRPRYFQQYRELRHAYERLRERGADPGTLEERRKAISEQFIKDCREMAGDARKLVICFDTIEQLQYESSFVELAAGLETVDTRVRFWILDTLKELRNVLVVFAGRPKPSSPDQHIDHQQRLEDDMRQAFGKDLSIVELKPFDLEETVAFIQAISAGADMIPESIMPVVHALTGGRPIFLHLLVDLLTLAPEMRSVLDRMEAYRVLAEAPANSPELTNARDWMEQTIVTAIFNRSGETGEYLRRMGLMPKGISQEILREVLGLPEEEAADLWQRLEKLSFVKHPRLVRGPQQVGEDRLFLHDEMYQLLRQPEVVQHLRIEERALARGLITRYYDPHLQNLDRQIKEERATEQRVPLKERWQKLSVERLFYLLTQDPRKGYEEYLRLSDIANRERAVGFGMRLLDEFLRFYNRTPDRRREFEKAGIPHDRVVRDAVHMWIERFNWWGQRDRLMQFARKVMDEPQTLNIRPDADIAIVANACARWASANVVAKVHDPTTVLREAEAMNQRLPPIAECSREQLIARARLATAIGWQYRYEGMLDQAVRYYKEANAAFRRSQAQPDEPGSHQDELAMLLNNLSYVYAQQGQMGLARPLAQEALRINERMDNRYSAALTLSTLAAIERLRGAYPEAVDYGEQALKEFRELEDAYGIALSYHSLAAAIRKLAKRSIEEDRKLDEARSKLEQAERYLNDALKEASGSRSEALIPQLKAEQGKVYREMGRLASRLPDMQHPSIHFRRSEECFREALQKATSPIEQADIRQDWAEALFAAGDYQAATQRLQEVRDLIAKRYQIEPGQLPQSNALAPQHFWIMGKVERLNGDIAFQMGLIEEGAEYYVLSHIYFMRFSTEALEVETVLQSMYRHLRQLPAQDQVRLLTHARQVANRYQMEAVHDFVRQFEDLIGL